MQTKHKLPQKKTRTLYPAVQGNSRAGKAKPTEDPTTSLPLTTTHFK